MRSMTGFSRYDHEAPSGHYTIEIRSVNSRYLEPHFRLPDALKSIEQRMREALKTRISRGKVEISLKYAPPLAEQELSVNSKLVESLNQAADQVHQIIGPGNALNALELLKWPGVIQESKLEQSMLEEDAMAGFECAVDNLIAMSQREGQALKGFITQRLSDIDEQVQKVRDILPQLMQARRQHMQDKLNELQVNVDAERLEQEMVILLQKADVDEELDRLQAHLTEVAHIVEQDGAVGRRLDFMMQELNREANTLSSKSTSHLTTQIAVELKVLIEQMREQIQNIE